MGLANRSYPPRCAGVKARNRRQRGAPVAGAAHADEHALALVELDRLGVGACGRVGATEDGEHVREVGQRIGVQQQEVGLAGQLDPLRASSSAWAGSPVRASTRLRVPRHITWETMSSLDAASSVTRL